MEFKIKYIWVLTTFIVLVQNLLFGLIVGMASFIIISDDLEIEELKKEIKKLKSSQKNSKANKK